MGFFRKKMHELEESDKYKDLGNITAQKASNIIKELGGQNLIGDVSLADNLVVFTNVNGGTGASTLTSNVAYKVSVEYELKVLVIDLNIQKPIQHSFLGMSQEQKEVHDLISVIEGSCTLAEAINSGKEYDLLFANNRTIADDIKCSLSGAINSFIDALSTLRNLYDLVIIDCPMDLKDNLINEVLYVCDTMYIVWDESLNSIANIDRVRRNMSYCGIDPFTKMRIIINKRTNIHYTNQPLKKLNLELIEVLPFDTSIIESSLRAEIFCKKAATNSKNAIEFDLAISRLAEKVVEIGGLVR